MHSVLEGKIGEDKREEEEIIVAHSANEESRKNVENTLKSIKSWRWARIVWLFRVIILAPGNDW